MKSFDSRTYSISDFLEWSRNPNQLELNPRFQRRNVWTDRARSYLMDTIVRGKPIPKVFIRQKINPTTMASIREVVDGQQRLRTILSYLNDGFVISKRHHQTYGGFFFSQLGEIDPDLQANILNYEISVDLLVNMPDSEVLDVFGRLNSYAVVLNEQEKINATSFGTFKILADAVGREYYEFWIKNRILTPQDILRMGEVTLVADLLIAMLEGIKSKKNIKGFYSAYEENFEHDPVALRARFDTTMADIGSVFGDSLPETAFRRIHQFYTLFTAFYHARFGLPGLDTQKPDLALSRHARILSALRSVDVTYAQKEEGKQLDERAEQFMEDSRRATTDASVRIRRTKYVLDLMLGA